MADGSDQFRVFATVYPVADLIRQVGGEWVTVDWFAEREQDLPALQPLFPADIGPDGGVSSVSPADADALPPAAVLKQAGYARLIVTSGLADVWADQPYDDNYRALHVIRPEALPFMRQTAQEAHWREGPIQKPWWLDPPAARALVEAVRDRLLILDSAHDADYRRNAEAYLPQLDALCGEYETSLAPLKGRKFIALRPLWRLLAYRYELEVMTPLNADARRLSDDDYRILRQTGLSSGAKALAVDADLPLAVLRQLEERTGLHPFSLDAFGSSAAAGRDTYLKLMRYNLKQLEQAINEK